MFNPIWSTSIFLFFFQQKFAEVVAFLLLGFSSKLHKLISFVSFEKSGFYHSDLFSVTI